MKLLANIPPLNTYRGMDYSKEVQDLILLMQLEDWWENACIWSLYVSSKWGL